MIEISIGPYRSGKTGRLLAQLIDYKREHPLDECLILVPSHRYGTLLRRQMAQLLHEQSSPGLFGVHIATIYQACVQILKGSGASIRVLPTELCVRAVADVLHKMHKSGQLKHLDSIHELSGTAAAMYRLIEEFERAAYTPNDVMRSLQSTAADAARNTELAAIYEQYWARLDQLGVVDQKRLALACRELLAKKQVPGLHLRWLLVDGFDRISPLQADIIDGISRHTAETRIAFDYILPADRAQQDPQDDEYAWKDTSYNELHKRFQVSPVTVGSAGDGTRPRQFAFSALDMFAEMQETARRCKEAIAVRGLKPDQVLVVARDMESYSCAANAAFKQAGIPYFIDAATELIALPWVKTALQLCRLAADEFPRRSVIDILRSQYVNIERVRLRSADVDRIDRASLRAEVIGGREQWSRALKESEELQDSIAELFGTVTPHALATAAEHASFVEDMLETLMVRFSSRPQAPSRGKSAEKTMAPSEQELQAVKGFRTALRTLLGEEELFGANKTTFEHFVDRLENLLQQANFRAPESLRECVHICSAEHAPNRRYDEVFVVGAREGQFPRHSGESGFVSSDERGRWQMFGVALNSPREEPGYEKALFRSLIERARKSFWVSHPQVDLSGDEIIPSFFLTDGTVVHGGIEKTDFTKQALLNPTAPREAIFGWLWKTPGADISGVLSGRPEVEEYWEQIAPICYGVAQRHQASGGGEFSGDLRAQVEAGWLQYKLPVAWSPSSLNSYGQCPFKFWATQMLGVTPVEEPEAGLDVQERGKLFHRVLELYYAKSLAESNADLSVVSETILEQALNESFAQLSNNPKFHPGPYWDNDRKEIAFRVRRFLEFDAQRLAKNPSIRPHLLEAKFGLPDSPFGPLRAKTSVGEIAIRGIIDRIDVERDAEGNVSGATVIDYKSGSTPISVDEARAGANLQVPLYALAVEQVILPGAPVKAGHYLSINGGKSIGTINFEKDTMQDILPAAKEHIAAIVAGVATGEFPVRPYSSKACSTCDHSSACRIVDLKRKAENEE